MKEKIIFDLDGTLMNADFSLEDDFFRERLEKMMQINLFL